MMHLLSSCKFISGWQLPTPRTIFRKEVSVMVEVKRKENESFDSLLRRFNRKIQQSGVLIRARKTRFFEPEPSRNLQRSTAIRRSELREIREEMKRTGKPAKPVKKGR
mgnify:CR=1 FL=1